MIGPMALMHATPPSVNVMVKVVTQRPTVSFATNVSFRHSSGPASMRIVSLCATASQNDAWRYSSRSKCSLNFRNAAITLTLGATGKSSRDSTSFRHFSFSNMERGFEDQSSDCGSKLNKKVALKYGRARRKRELRRREQDSPSSAVADDAIHVDRSVVDDATKYQEDRVIIDQDKSLNELIREDRARSGATLFGMPIGNPLRERYIMSQRKVKYPRTWSGWKTVLGRTWEKWLWTFEGFLIKEKKRDADGNIIPDDEGDDELGFNQEDKNLRDKAKDAADHIAQNVERNISTMKKEGPKLIQMGQEMTGISTKEELREWISEQLKLATACISEFMKGYRTGRDEEVDRMLHEYFQDLDKDDEKSSESSDGAAKSNEMTSEEEAGKKAQRWKKRKWGRLERRKLKVLKNRVVSMSSKIPD